MKTFLLLLATVSFADDKTSAPVMPETCKVECATPFGAVLGKTADGTEAHSNCKPKCVYENPVTVDKNFAGIQWQCVEFARRWLMMNKRLTFDSIDVAADLWNKIDHLTNYRSKETVPLRNVLNGSSSLPKEGDLVIWGREYLDTGHVAIVLKVDEKKSRVLVGEENFLNKPWPGNYARAIPYVKHDKGYWLLDPYLIGWKTY